MAESVLIWLAMAFASGYGVYALFAAMAREQEDRRRESELAWQRDGL